MPLACIVAYYGDGSLTEEEFEALLLVADSAVAEDIPDRELVKKELLLDVLDALKETLDEFEDKHNKFNFALEVTETFAFKTMFLINQVPDDKKKEEYKNTISEIFINVAKSDGQYSDEEKLIIKTIRKNFGLTWTWEHTLGCGAILLIIWLFVWIVRALLGWLDWDLGNLFSCVLWVLSICFVIWVVRAAIKWLAG